MVEEKEELEKDLNVDEEVEFWFDMVARMEGFGVAGELWDVL